MSEALGATWPESDDRCLDLDRSLCECRRSSSSLSAGRHRDRDRLAVDAGAAPAVALSAGRLRDRDRLVIVDGSEVTRLSVRAFRPSCPSSSVLARLRRLVPEARDRDRLDLAVKLLELPSRSGRRDLDRERLASGTTLDLDLAGSSPPAAAAAPHSRRLLLLLLLLREVGVGVLLRIFRNASWTFRRSTLFKMVVGDAPDADAPPTLALPLPMAAPGCDATRLAKSLARTLILRTTLPLLLEIGPGQGPAREGPWADHLWVPSPPDLTTTRWWPSRCLDDETIGLSLGCCCCCCCCRCSSASSCTPTAISNSVKSASGSFP
jgi:hypothetical protein